MYTTSKFVPPPPPPPAFKTKKRRPEKTAAEKLGGCSLLAYIAGLDLPSIARYSKSQLPSPGMGLVLHDPPVPQPPSILPLPPGQITQLPPLPTLACHNPTPPALLPPPCGMAPVQYIPIMYPCYVPYPANATLVATQQPAPTQKAVDTTKPAAKTPVKSPPADPPTPPKLPTAKPAPSATKVQISSSNAPVEVSTAVLRASALHFLASHVCARCGRERSRRFHRQHPLVPGEAVTPSVCRHCLRKAGEQSKAAAINEKKVENTEDQRKPHRSERTYRIVVDHSRSRSRSRGRRSKGQPDYDRVETRYRYRRSSRVAHRDRSDSRSSGEIVRVGHRGRERRRSETPRPAQRARRSVTPPSKAASGSLQMKNDVVMRSFRHIPAPLDRERDDDDYYYSAHERGKGKRIVFTPNDQSRGPKAHFQEHGTMQGAKRNHQRTASSTSGSFIEIERRERAFKAQEKQATARTAVSSSRQDSVHRSETSLQSKRSEAGKQLQHRQPSGLMRLLSNPFGHVRQPHKRDTEVRLLTFKPAQGRRQSRFEVPKSREEEEPPPGVKREIVVIRPSPSPERRSRGHSSSKPASEVLSGYESYHRYHMTPPSPPAASRLRSHVERPNTDSAASVTASNRSAPSGATQREGQSRRSESAGGVIKKSGPNVDNDVFSLANRDPGLTRPYSERTVVSRDDHHWWEETSYQDGDDLSDTTVEIPRHPDEFDNRHYEIVAPKVGRGWRL